MMNLEGQEKEYIPSPVVVALPLAVIVAAVGDGDEIARHRGLGSDD